MGEVVLKPVPGKKGLYTVEGEASTLDTIVGDYLKLAKENEQLRKILWLRHGCSISKLYGDDGEMQCSFCRIDFKRDPLQRIQEGILYAGKQI